MKTTIKLMLLALLTATFCEAANWTSSWTRTEWAGYQTRIEDDIDGWDNAAAGVNTIIINGTTGSANTVTFDLDNGDDYRFVRADGTAEQNGLNLIIAINELNARTNAARRFIQLDAGEYDLGTNSNIDVSYFSIVGVPKGKRVPAVAGTTYNIGSVIQYNADNSTGLFDADTNPFLLKDVTVEYEGGTEVAGNGFLFAAATDDDCIIENCDIDVNVDYFAGVAWDTRFQELVNHSSPGAISPKFFRCVFKEDDCFKIDATGGGAEFNYCDLRGQDYFQSTGTVVLWSITLRYCTLGNDVDAGNDWYAGGTVLSKIGAAHHNTGIPSFCTNFTSWGNSFNTDQSGAEITSW